MGTILMWPMYNNVLADVPRITLGLMSFIHGQWSQVNNHTTGSSLNQESDSEILRIPINGERTSFLHME